MKYTKTISAIEMILEQLIDDEHITEDFKEFVIRILMDNNYNSNISLDYSITSALKFNSEWFKTKTIKEIIEECKIILNDRVNE